MTEDHPNDFPLGLARLAEEERRRQGTEHPTHEWLGDYIGGRLGPPEIESLQDHLAVCPDCVKALAELRRFQEMMDAEEPETSVETEASWQALRSRLAPLRGAPQPVPRRVRRWTPTPRSFYALAAALLACVIGFPLWLRVHPQEAPLIVVQPGAFEVTRGEGESRSLVTLALGEQPAVLSLPVPSRAPFPAYRVEIRTLQNETRLTLTPLPLPVATAPVDTDPPRLVVFALSQGALAGGEYRLRLVGLRGAREEVLVEHRLRVADR